MKLSDVALWESDDEAVAAVRDTNATVRPFPHDRTVGDLFTEQATATPDAVAVVDGSARRTYAELAADADRLAGFLVDQGVGPGVYVGVLLRRSYRLVVALLAVLKAGGAYVPLNPELPDARLYALVRDTAPRVLISERSLITTFNDLFWNSPATSGAICVDSFGVLGELEPAGTRMSLELWNYVADHADDPVAANGWRSPYTGARISDETLDQYVRATANKIAAYLSPDATMLEIGCGTGTTLKGLAPLVGRYVGIDPSAGVLRWAQRARQENALDNVSLYELAALNLDELPVESAGPFDIVVFNSVVQSFGGMNYLRTVLGEAIARIGDCGAVYLGHVWDAARREEFLATVAARHRPEHGGRPLSAADALFIPAAFFEDLPHHFPELVRVEVTPMAFHDEELTTFAYDVLLHVVRTTSRTATASADKRQYDRRALDVRPAAPVDDQHSPDATAYVIQTSGSTGVPKSVEVGMRSLVNLLWWYTDACAMGPGTRVLQVITCGFDASIKNYLAPLIAGAGVVLAPDTAYDPRALLDLVVREKVTVLNPGVPSAVYPLVGLAAADGFRPLRSLRHLALGGETPDLTRFRPWLESGECQAILLNIYGPTEATDISCAARIDPTWAVADSSPVPIGRPIPNVRAYVLDSRLVEQPPGVVGELCLAGVGLAKGYVGDPALTAEKFTTASPSLPGERLYRTGDLARRLPTGDLIVVGRADAQVKLLGHRIELGEVEQCLRALPGVREAAAVLRPVPGTDELRLCGYVIPEPGEEPDALSLRAALGRCLPTAAVPADVVVMDSWPRTPNGKTDRNALPAPEQAHRAAACPPRTATERVLLPLWREVLADDTVSLDENFFVAGGHSLGAALLAIRIREVLRRGVSIIDVYQAQTAAALARLIDQRPAADSPLKLLADGDGAAIYCFPPIAGYAWTMAGFAQHLGFRVYGFDFPDAADPAATAAGLIAATRTSGPRFLIGYSAGGVLAAATALALQARGESVDGMVLLDSAPPAGRTPATDDDVAQTVREVLGDPRLTAHVHQTGADRVADTVTRYARWYAEAPLDGTIRCDLLLLTASDGDPGYITGWQALTIGDVHVQPAGGSHVDLLSGTHAVVNAGPVRTWLAQRSSTTKPFRNR